MDVVVTDSAPATFDRLREQISRHPGDPYLLSVTAENRPHCGTVTVQWDAAGRRLLTAAPSSWPGSADRGYCQVSLVWPPPIPGGRSLIVDGAASATADGDMAMLTIRPTRAVLYRSGVGSPGTDTSCSNDCIPIPIPSG